MPVRNVTRDEYRMRVRIKDRRVDILYIIFSMGQKLHWQDLPAPCNGPFLTIVIRADPRDSIWVWISCGRLPRTLSLSEQKQREASWYYNVTRACYGIRNLRREYRVLISWKEYVGYVSKRQPPFHIAAVSLSLTFGRRTCRLGFNFLPQPQTVGEIVSWYLISADMPRRAIHRSLIHECE